MHTFWTGTCTAHEQAVQPKKNLFHTASKELHVQTPGLAQTTPVLQWPAAMRPKHRWHSSSWKALKTPEQNSAGFS